MTPAKVNALATILLGANVGFAVTANKDVVGDWVVTCTPGVAVDVSQVAAIESQIGVTAPVTGEVTFV